MRRGLTLGFALLALGCQTAELEKGLPPGLSAQMDEALRRAQYTQGATRLAELRKLSAFGPHATGGVMKEMLLHRDPQVRSNAIFVLGEIFRLDGDAKALDAVRQAMQDGDEMVRLEASRALLEAGDWSGLDGLIGALDHPNRGTRARSFLALQNVAGSDFGYHPDANPERRQAAMAEFREHFARLSP